MAFAPADLRSECWRAASALVLIALCSRGALGQAPSARSVLVVPVRSHWVSAPLAEAITRALPDALTKAGFAVTQWDSAASASAPWATRIIAPDTREASEVESAQHLAVAAETQAALVTEVVESDSQADLRAQLTGALSHREVGLEVSASATGSKEQLARELARSLAEKITPEAWTQAGADPEGRQLAAAERYAAGRQAMGLSMYRDAALEFEAALAGDPNSPDYLRAAATAQVARGDSAWALALLRRLGGLRPNDAQVFLDMGDLSLALGQPAQAEAAFLTAATAVPSDLRATEGLARAVRAQGQTERAQQYYRQVVDGLPELAGSPPSLPGLLADQRDDSIRLTAVPPAEVGLPLGRLYLKNGYYAEGVRALLAYQRGGGRPPYPDADYLAIAAGLDAESEKIAERVAALSDRSTKDSGDDDTDAELSQLHQRSDDLATLAERMRASARLDPAHRYRVLAYNLLNESDFEALFYWRTHDADRQQRANLLRDASRAARAQAQQLGAGLAGTAK